MLNGGHSRYNHFFPGNAEVDVVGCPFLFAVVTDSSKFNFQYLQSSRFSHICVNLVA